MSVAKRLERSSLIVTFVAFLSWITFAQTVVTAPPAAKPAAAQSTEQLVAELQKLLADEVAAQPSLPGELLHVHAPKQGIDVSLAAGVFDKQSKQSLIRITFFVLPALPRRLSLLRFCVCMKTAKSSSTIQSIVICLTSTTVRWMPELTRRAA